MKSRRSGASSKTSFTTLRTTSRLRPSRRRGSRSCRRPPSPSPSTPWTSSSASRLDPRRPPQPLSLRRTPFLPSLPSRRCEAERNLPEPLEPAHEAVPPNPRLPAAHQACLSSRNHRTYPATSSPIFILREREVPPAVVATPCQAYSAPPALARPLSTRPTARSPSQGESRHGQPVSQHQDSNSHSNSRILSHGPFYIVSPLAGPNSCRHILAAMALA